MGKNYSKLAIWKHKKLKGKLEITPKANIKNQDDLSIFYTPGVAAPCLEIAKNPKTSSHGTLATHTYSKMLWQYLPKQKKQAKE